MDKALGSARHLSSVFGQAAQWLRPPIGNSVGIISRENGGSSEVCHLLGGIVSENSARHNIGRKSREFPGYLRMAPGADLD